RELHEPDRAADPSSRPLHLFLRLRRHGYCDDTITMPTPSRKKQRFSAAPAAPKVRPRVLLLSAMSLLSAPLHLACASPPATEPPPTPALAASKGAQREFRSLSSRWHVADPAQRNRLETEFRSFLSRYPNDDQTRLASAYLAWIL